MQPREARDQVHPLPPEGAKGPHGRSRSVRGLLPLLAGGSLLVAFVVIAGLGDRGDQDPTGFSSLQTAITSTSTSPLPPTTSFAPLRVPPVPEPVELPEELKAGLFATFVHDDDGSLRIARWHPERSFVHAAGLASPLDGNDAMLDASGFLVATLDPGSTNLLSSTQLLSVGPVVLGVSPVFVTVHGFAWHATKPGMLALAGVRPGDTHAGVFVLRFDRLGVLQSTERLAEATPTSRVIGFTDRGIALIDSPVEAGISRIHVVQPDGTMISTPGTAWLTSESLIIGAVERDGGTQTTALTWELETATQTDHLVEFIDSDLALSPSGRVGAIVGADESTVRVRSTDMERERTVDIGSQVSSLGFVTEDHLVAFSSTDKTLFVVAWRTGEIYALPLEARELIDVVAPSDG